MLKPLPGPPTDLGKQSEVSRTSATFDRLTEDQGDLRLHTSTDGKTKYLRVWSEGDKQQWFQIVPAPKKAATER